MYLMTALGARTTSATGAASATLGLANTASAASATLGSAITATALRTRTRTRLHVWYLVYTIM